MPELPEVETVRRTLEPRLLGRTVVGATLRRRDVLVVPGDPPGGFSRSARPGRPAPRPRRRRAGDLLEGETIVELARRGKQLALVGGSGRGLLVHLGMTGQVLHLEAGARLAADRRTHVHALWRLDDGSRLLFRDPRRFGGLWALPAGGEGSLGDRWAALGPDAIAVTGAELGERLGRTSRGLKAALLDQGVVAGVGNIYADEALFAAGLHPLTPADALGAAEADRLAAEIRRVLAAAVAAGGSSIRSYVDALGASGGYQRTHLVYGRGGEPCARCGRALRSAVVAQRTTVFCEACQPLTEGRSGGTCSPRLSV